MSIIPKFFQNAVDAASLKVYQVNLMRKTMVKGKKVQRVMISLRVYIRQDL